MAPAATVCSRRSSRDIKLCRSAPAASWVSCTNATSSSSRGSGAWRISTSISPRRSIARTIDAAPSRGCQRRHLLFAFGRKLHQLGCHQRQEAVAEVADDLLGQRPRVAALLHGMGNDGERPARIVLDERLDELVERRGLGRLATAGGDQLERRDGVARRAAALAQHGLRQQRR